MRPSNDCRKLVRVQQTARCSRSVRIGISYSSGNMKLILGLVAIAVFSLIQCDIKGASAAAESKDDDGYEDLPFYFFYIQLKVDEKAKNHTTQEVLDGIHSSTSGKDTIYAYVALHKNMKKNNKTDDPAIIDLAYHLKDAMGALNTTSREYKAANQLKMNLPRSVSNLAFAKCVIIRRAQKNEDLYAATDEYKKDDKRRRVFTWIPGKPQNNKQGCWTMKRVRATKNGAPFFIRNTNSKEYLYAAYDKYNIDEQSRAVFTWTPGGSDKQSRWSLEPSGVNIYIKNMHFNEYLSTDYNRRFDKNRRKVYTAISKKKEKKSLWKIVNGDNIK